MGVRLGGGADAPLAVLVANGPLPPRARGRLAADAAVCDLLVGIDGGARHLRDLGLRPHAITGDFDSLPEDERAVFAAEGARIVPTPDQNYTDLDKALSYAVDVRGARRVRVYAATGGRLDHIYSALSALVKHARRGVADVCLVDEIGTTWRVPDGGAAYTLSGPHLPGRTLSLMALGPVEGVTTTGVRWPLTEEALAPGVRDGTLNVIDAETVTVSVRSGDLLAMLHHERAAVEREAPMR